MSRMKTFLMYTVWIILFFVLSNLLINVNLEARYKNIERKDNLEQIRINQAEATSVNGRIKGNVNGKIESKYLKLDFYSERDILMGTKYIEIESENQIIEMHFKLNNVAYYNISEANEKDESITEINLLPEDISYTDIFWGAFLLRILI